MKENDDLEPEDLEADESWWVSVLSDESLAAEDDTGFYRAELADFHSEDPRQGENQ